MALPPVFIEFLGSYAGVAVAAAGVKKELAEVDAEGSMSMKGLGAASSAVLFTIGAAAAGAAYEGIKLATTFQAAMNRIVTQAGAPRAQLGLLSNDILNLAGQVGFSPDSLAEALYHVESSFASIGISSTDAMKILTTAAKGAAVGGANLVDVQNALDAAIASGIPGVENYSQAMGTLNAIVGSGDMEMQDLADALGTGVLAVVKGYGLTLTDVGSALATFGDNNIRGAVAATDLRMAVQALSVPAKTASVDLKKMGMDSNTLADDLKKGGLSLALNDLSKRMHKAGLDGKNMGETITTMFGKKAGSGLAVLMSQIDRFNSKYPELQKSANGFDSAVSANNATLQQHIKQAEAALEALGVRIGTAVLPYVTSFMGELSKGLSFLSSHTGVFKVFAVGIGAVTAAMVVARLATIAWSESLLANPIVLIVAAIAALAAGVYYAYTHFKGFRDAVQDVWHALQTAASWFDRTVIHSKLLQSVIAMVSKEITKAWHAAWNEVGSVINWFEKGPLALIKQEIASFSKFWDAHSKDIEQIAKAVWKLIGTVIVGEAKIMFAIVKNALTDFEQVWRIVWGVIRDVIKLAWDLIANVVRAGTKIFLDIISLFLDLLHGRWSKLGPDLGHLLVDALNGIKTILYNFGKDALKLLYDAGMNIIKGLVNGIKAGFGMVKNVVGDLGGVAKGAFHSIMGIFSPSRVMYQSGTYVVAGLVNALRDGAGDIYHASRGMGQAVIRGVSPTGDTSIGAMHIEAPNVGTSGGYGGGVVQYVVQLEVQGHVITDQDLRDLIQEELLKKGARNTGTFQPAKI